MWRDVTGQQDPSAVCPEAYARLDFDEDFGGDGPKEQIQSSSSHSAASTKRFSFFITSLAVVIGRVPPKSSDTAVGYADIDLGPIKNISRRHLKIAYDVGLGTWAATVLSKKNTVSINSVLYSGETVVPLTSGSVISVSTRRFSFFPQAEADDATLKMMSNPLYISEPDMGKAKNEIMAPRASKLKAAAAVTVNRSVSPAAEILHKLKREPEEPERESKKRRFLAHPLLYRKKAYDKHYRADDDDSSKLTRPTETYATLIETVLQEAADERVRYWTEELHGEYQPSGPFAKPESADQEWKAGYPPLLAKKSAGQTVYVQTRMTMQEICDVLATRFDYFRENRSANWQTAVKSALTKDNIFIKLEEGKQVAYALNPKPSNPPKTSKPKSTPTIRIAERPEFNDSVRYIIADGHLYLSPTVFGSFTPAQIAQIQGLNMDGTQYLLDTYIARYNAKSGIQPAQPSQEPLQPQLQTQTQLQASVPLVENGVAKQESMEALSALPEDLRSGIREALKKNDLDTLYVLYAKVDKLKKEGKV